MNPLSFEEHRDLGRELVNARARLVQLAGVVTSVYGPESLSAFHFQKLNEAMDRVCDELQVQARRDCPGLDTAQFYK